jgi:hypothetical protein
MQDERYTQPGDIRLRDEAEFGALVQQYDVVIADRMLRRAAPQFEGVWIDFPHYAVSGSAQW